MVEMLKAQAGGATLTSPSTQTLDAAILGSMDSTLIQLLPSRVVEAIYDHIDRAYSVSKKEIPQNFTVLCSVLEQLVGKQTGRAMSLFIARRVFQDLGLVVDLPREFDLEHCIQFAKSQVGARGNR